MSIRRINPLVRAVATMGAIAALVGGVTFAALTSNTVALTNNTLSSATASLQIALGNGTDCTDFSNTSQQGMQITKLAPGVPTDPFLFCLKNTGDTNLNVTTGIPTDFTGSQIPPQDVTLKLTCAGNAAVSGTLDQYTGGTALVTPLDSGDAVDCNAVVTLNNSFIGTGTSQSVKPFDINFVGTSSSTT